MPIGRTKIKPVQPPDKSKQRSIDFYFKKPSADSNALSTPLRPPGGLTNTIDTGVSVQIQEKQRSDSNSKSQPSQNKPIRKPTRKPTKTQKQKNKDRLKNLEGNQNPLGDKTFYSSLPPDTIHSSHVSGHIDNWFKHLIETSLRSKDAIGSDIIRARNANDQLRNIPVSVVEAQQLLEFMMKTPPKCNYDIVLKHIRDVTTLIDATISLYTTSKPDTPKPSNGNRPHLNDLLKMSLDSLDHYEYCCPQKCHLKNSIHSPEIIARHRSLLAYKAANLETMTSGTAALVDTFIAALALGAHWKDHTSVSMKLILELLRPELRVKHPDVDLLSVITVARKLYDFMKDGVSSLPTNGDDSVETSSKVSRLQSNRPDVYAELIRLLELESSTAHVSQELNEKFSITISPRTVGRIARRAGYHYCAKLNSKARPSHERPDVITYRDEDFIPKMLGIYHFLRWHETVKGRALMAKLNEDQRADYMKCGDDFKSWLTLRGYTKIAIACHDESTIQSAAEFKYCWQKLDARVHKSNARSPHFMVDAIMCACHGVKLGASNISAGETCTRVPAMFRHDTFPGYILSNGFANAQHCADNFAKSCELLNKAHNPNDDNECLTIILVDNATTHIKRVKVYEPKNAKIRLEKATEEKDLHGLVTEYVNTDGDTVSQVLVTSEGNYRPLYDIAAERGILKLTTTTTGKNVTRKYTWTDDPTRNLGKGGVVDALNECPDIVKLAERGNNLVLEEVASVHHCHVMLLPKCHPELNPIELVWAELKQKTIAKLNKIRIKGGDKVNLLVAFKHTLGFLNTLDGSVASPKFGHILRYSLAYRTGDFKKFKVKNISEQVGGSKRSIVGLSNSFDRAENSGNDDTDDIDDIAVNPTTNTNATNASTDAETITMSISGAISNVGVATVVTEVKSTTNTKRAKTGVATVVTEVKITTNTKRAKVTSNTGVVTAVRSTTKTKKGKSEAHPKPKSTSGKRKREYLSDIESDSDNTNWESSDGDCSD